MSSNQKYPATPPEEAFVGWTRRLRNSDRDAFAEIFQAMHAALLRYSLRLVGDENAARDVVQDVFFKLWQVRESLDGDRSLKAYLYAMVHNLSLNHNRNHNQQGFPLTEAEDRLCDDTAGADEQIGAEMLSETINQWIEQMPERRREAFLLSRMHGMSHEEIADIMNLTPRTVNTHIVLALKYLRGRLDVLQPQRTQS